MIKEIKGSDLAQVNGGLVKYIPEIFEQLNRVSNPNNNLNIRPGNGVIYIQDPSTGRTWNIYKQPSLPGIPSFWF